MTLERMRQAMLPNAWRPYLDTIVSTIAFMLVMYMRIPAPKRLAFEKKHPRWAAVVGMAAALAPFFPMFAHYAKQCVFGLNETTTPLVSLDSAPPSAPWHESGAHSPRGDAVLPARDDPSP